MKNVRTDSGSLSVCYRFLSPNHSQTNILILLTQYALFVVVIVAFDLSEIDSLTHVIKWKEDACRAAANPNVFLVGLKKDLMVCTTL